MKSRDLVCFFLLFCLFPNIADAQKTLSSAELERLLEKAETATRQYTETFKNLSAQEIKTFTDYNKTGELKETRRIKSNFIVYQIPNDENVNEFRKVTEFNNTAVVQSDEEVEKLFDKLAFAGSTTNENKLLRNEALRYDGRSSAWGMTLWQESPFGKLKSFFEFKYVGRERIGGNDTFVIEYQQIKPTLLLKFNPTEKDWKKEPDGREYHALVSSSLRPANARQSGKIWLDVKTAQIWRNELKISLQPPQLDRSVVALELNYEYQPSAFKILVPEKFSYTIYKISGSGSKNLTVNKDRTMLFEYSKFSEFKTDTKDYKITAGNK